MIDKRSNTGWDGKGKPFKDGQEKIRLLGTQRDRAAAGAHRESLQRDTGRDRSATEGVLVDPAP